MTPLVDTKGTTKDIVAVEKLAPCTTCTTVHNTQKYPGESAIMTV